MGLPCQECAGLIGHGANLTVNAPVTVTAPAVRPTPLSFSQPLANSQILALFHDVPRSARRHFSAKLACRLITNSASLFIFVAL
jgi:hypothetical protein